ncbi:glycosyltransferase [Lachnospiraceae bacterium 48-33]
MKTSIIVPVFNQYEALVKTLYGFSLQQNEKDSYEVVVVDDGSTDDTSLLTDDSLCSKFDINIKIIHGRNRGRSYARNCGVRHSKADYIIFCDCDRVPAVDFVDKHLSWKDKNVDIVIGQSMDYFGRSEYISSNLDWDKVKKFSKTPNYLKRITKIYDVQQNTKSLLVWMSFLVGNSSMKKELLIKLGGFDEMFTKWGFEHFDFAYRAWKAGKKFAYDEEIRNYHIPHVRENRFYEKAIDENILLFNEKYPEINGNAMRNILLTNNDVTMYEKTLFNNK